MRLITGGVVKGGRGSVSRMAIVVKCLVIFWWTVNTSGRDRVKF